MACWKGSGAVDSSLPVVGCVPEETRSAFRADSENHPQCADGLSESCDCPEPPGGFLRPIPPESINLAGTASRRSAPVYGCPAPLPAW